MWKQLLIKIAGNLFFKKAKTWLVESGLANILYLGIGLGIWITPIIPMTFKSHISIGSLSIFVYLNWNVIRKLIFKEEN